MKWTIFLGFSLSMLSDVYHKAGQQKYFREGVDLLELLYVLVLRVHCLQISVLDFLGLESSFDTDQT